MHHQQNKIIKVVPVGQIERKEYAFDRKQTAVFQHIIIILWSQFIFGSISCFKGLI